MSRLSLVSCLPLALVLAACGAEDPASPSDGGAGAAGAAAGAAGGSSAAEPAVTAAEVVSFTPGKNGGFGADQMPDVVLGPPKGGGTGMGSTDVVSLGVGGEIVLAFGAWDVVDGPGPDFLVFENPFWIGSSPSNVYAELGEVSVSEDGVTWTTFPCDTAAYTTSTCAGWHPVLANAEIPADDPALAGGDPFDLAAIGVARARYVKIRDLSKGGAAPTAGFDLDGAALVHREKAR